ncbi:MAG: hypothetical protein ACK4PR_09395, partial [Gammaproteobacteria bacterium]
AATAGTSGSAAPVLAPAALAFGGSLYQTYVSTREVIDHVKIAREIVHKQEMIPLDLFYEATRQANITLPWTQLLTIFDEMKIVTWQDKEAMSVIYYITELLRTYPNTSTPIDKIASIFSKIYMANYKFRHVQTFILENCHILNRAGYIAFPKFGNTEAESTQNFQTFIIGKAPEHYQMYVDYKAKTLTSEARNFFEKQILKDKNIKHNFKDYYISLEQLKSNINLTISTQASFLSSPPVTSHQYLYEPWFTQFANDRNIYQAQEIYNTLQDINPSNDSKNYSETLIAIEALLKQAKDKLSISTFTSDWGRNTYKFIDKKIQPLLEKYIKRQEEEHNNAIAEWQKAQDLFTVEGPTSIGRLFVAHDIFKRPQMTTEEASVFYENVKKVQRDDDLKRYKEKIIRPRLMHILGQLQISEGYLGGITTDDSGLPVAPIQLPTTTTVTSPTAPIPNPGTTLGTLYSAAAATSEASATTSGASSSKPIASYKSMKREDDKNCYRVTISYARIASNKAPTLQPILVEGKKNSTYMPPPPSINDINNNGYIRIMDFDEEEAAQMLVESIEQFLSAEKVEAPSLGAHH